MAWPADRLSPIVRGSSALEAWIERPALEQLPRRQIQWAAGSALAGLIASWTPLWWTHPEIAVALALGVGASAVNTRRLWLAPLVGTAVTLGGLFSAALGFAAVVGAGLVAGVVATALVKERSDALDLVHGALATMAGATIGLWAATALVPAGATLAAPLTTGIVALLAAQGLVPTALRFDGRDRLPSPREITRALRVAYRPAVFKAIDLYNGCNPRALDALSRRGLEEIAAWVFRLQISLQSRDQELASIDPDAVRYRIEAHRSVDPTADPVTRDPRAAAIHHLERLLEHRVQIEIERSRTEALADYALAYLEEARAGLALARDLPGDAVPEGLGEVLHRLRGYADESRARRNTSRELNSLRP